jgi:perosamine synthetase
MYGIFIKNESTLSKEKLMIALEKAGVGTRSFFYSLSDQPAFAKYNKNDCPNARLLGERGFYLPSGQSLTDEQIKWVSQKIHEIVSTMRQE